MEKSFLGKAAYFLFPLILLGFSFPLKAQPNSWAVGFRVGEPSGINIRKYIAEKQAFDLNIGTYGGVYGMTREYRRGYYRTVGLCVQGHYLWIAPVEKKPNFHYYYGLGSQLNSRRYYPEGPSTAFKKNISLGGSGIAGLEYFVPNRHVSVFLETGIYLEVLPFPFFLTLQSCLGVRFNL